MKSQAELEISLHRQRGATFEIDLRFTDPESDAAVSRVGTFTLEPEELLARQEDHRAYGVELARQIFCDQKIKATWIEARAVVDRKNVPLRILLVVGRELQALRWELLVDPKTRTSLATSERVFFSRFVRSDDWRAVKLRQKTALRALVAVSAPPASETSRFGLAEVKGEEEGRRACDSLRDIEVKEVAAPLTRGRLTERLRREVDVLYLVCHGRMAKRGRGPGILLQDDEGKAEWVAAERFVEGIHTLLQPPRLVVLASCDGAADSAARAQAALAPLLADAGVPAIVAMQGKISMATVAQAMPVFFRELLADGRIELAMARARREVRDRHDFWMPVLYHRLTDGRLWAEPRPAETTLQVGDLTRVPYRCNRYPQIQELERTLPLLKGRRPSRPLVLLMAGHAREAHDRFFDRLARELLPDYLDIAESQPVVPKGPCELVDPQRGRIEQRCEALWRRAAKTLYGSTVTGLDDMALAIAGERCPVIIDVLFPVTREVPPPDRELMRAWLAQLGTWPEPDQPLVFVLRFSWGDTEERSSFLRKSASARVIALVEGLERWADAERLVVVALPPLESIDKHNVMTWVDVHGGPFLNREKGRIAADLDLKGRLCDRVDELFDQQERLPMGKLGRRLKHHLEELLAVGGSLP